MTLSLYQLSRNVLETNDAIETIPENFIRGQCIEEIYGRDIEEIKENFQIENELKKFYSLDSVVITTELHAPHHREEIIEWNENYLYVTNIDISLPPNYRDDILITLEFSILRRRLILTLPIIQGLQRLCNSETISPFKYLIKANLIVPVKVTTTHDIKIHVTYNRHIGDSWPGITLESWYDNIDFRLFVANINYSNYKLTNTIFHCPNLKEVRIIVNDTNAININKLTLREAYRRKFGTIGDNWYYIPIKVPIIVKKFMMVATKDETVELYKFYTL